MSESPWTFPAESASLGADNTVTLVDGTTFMVCLSNGDIQGRGAGGLFMLDTRVLSTWLLQVNGSPVQPLVVTPNGPFSATFVGRVEDPDLVDAPLTVVQRRHVGHGMREDLEVRNHGTAAMTVRVELVAQSDFASVFDVKAGGRPDEQVVGARFNGSGATIPATAVSGAAVEATTVWCSDEPDMVHDSTLVWDRAVEPGGRWTTCMLVEVTVDGNRLPASNRCGEPVEDAIPVSRLRRWRETVTTIETDDPELALAVSRASEDLGALRIFDPDHPDRVVVAAGAPWYMTLFGRDSLIAAWMSLPLGQDLARGVLAELADAQGDKVDEKTEEQPGRILHEVRFDSVSARLLGGSNTYFGTIDATPLFVMLVAELGRWTGVTSHVESLMPAVDRAMQWIDDSGDRDGDGFVEYLRSDPGGLQNQGWKDSWDGIRHLDGSIPTGPIALCEVQGYVYAAHRGRADLARALGEPDSVATAHDARADAMRDRFNDRFWQEDLGWFAVGLDGDKEPIRSLTSNIGHLLWTGIVDRTRAHQVAEHLGGPALFSGWGLRTLSADNAGYNPLSYHCGSVWPHDTALAVAGLHRYGFDDVAHRLTRGLLATATWTDGRLPELFAGFDRHDLPSPVPYPASCSPQAWAAASPLLLVRAMLGFDPDLLSGRLHLRPRLPPGVGTVRLGEVPVGDDRITIEADGDDMDIRGLGSDVSVEIDRP